MSVKLQRLFLWLGCAVATILFCFHLYLRERGEVRQVVWETGKWEELKTGHWGPPAVSRLTTPEFGDVSLRRLASLERRRYDVTRRNQIMRIDDRGREKEGEDYRTSHKRNQDLDNHDSVENSTFHMSENVVNKSTASEKLSPNSTEGVQDLTDRFSVRRPFSLPTPEATLPLPQLLRCQWVNDLRTYLTSLPRHSRHVSLVSSDYKYREVLLNWLILARVQLKQPLTNILVLSLDESLHHLLRDRGIPCVYVPISCLLRRSLPLTHHVAFTQVHIMRVLVMRLLNHWGYDVTNYDTDALVVRNPETRYSELGDRHFVGSVGHFPHELDRRWGTAVCIGVVLIRASPHTELYWEAMSGVIPDQTNDQARLNWALVAMETTWDNPHSNSAEVIMTGAGRGGFRAAVLPTKDVCRQTCKKSGKGYLVWHKGGAQSRDGKKAYASRGGLWRLRDDWQVVNKHTSSKGVKWLSEIAIAT